MYIPVALGFVSVQQKLLDNACIAIAIFNMYQLGCVSQIYADAVLFLVFSFFSCFYYIRFSIYSFLQLYGFYNSFFFFLSVCTVLSLADINFLWSM